MEGLYWVRNGPNCGFGATNESVARPRGWRKIFLELAVHALKFFRVGRLVLLLGDVRPALGVLVVDLEPLFEPGLGVRLDGISRALRLAHAAIDAFVRMDHQHVLALVEAIDGADLDAVGVLALDAGLSDDVSHPTLRNGRFSAIFLARC